MSLLPLLPSPAPSSSGLDPETAHELTMHSLARLQGTPLEWAYCNGMVDDPIELAGLQVSQPRRPGRRPRQERTLHRRLGAMGFGFVEVAPSRPSRSPATPSRECSACRRRNALINRLGFNNDGLEAFIANVKRSSLSPEGPHPAA